MKMHNRLSLVFSLCGMVAACDEQAPPDMDTMVEAHTELIRDRIAANNTKDWDTWESLHTEDAVRTAPDLEAPLVGAAAMRADIEELVVTFPDYHLELVEAFGQGDRLVVRIHTRGTMLGPITIGGVEVPPTGLDLLDPHDIGIGVDLQIVLDPHGGKDEADLAGELAAEGLDLVGQSMAALGVDQAEEAVAQFQADGVEGEDGEETGELALEEGAWLKLRHYKIDHYFKFGAFGDAHRSRDDVARIALR